MNLHANVSKLECTKHSKLYMYRCYNSTPVNEMQSHVTRLVEQLDWSLIVSVSMPESLASSLRFLV